MTKSSTTIRVTKRQRQRLRELAQMRSSTMADTLDAALEALRRQHFYAEMAEAEERLRADPARWAEYTQDRDEWLTADLS